MGYKQLNYLQRCKIQAFWNAGCTEQQIANEIGFSKSTISREFSRNMTFIRTKYGYWTYKAGYAQTYAENRRKNKNYPIKFNKAVEDFVKDKLLEDWSPEQISGYAARKCIFWISHERIYQYILKDKEQGGDIYQHLRHQHKKYRKRYGSAKREGPIKNRVLIDNRPEIVDKKERIGDWEIDCIIGKNHKQAVVSIVDRVSKFTILKKVKTKHAKTVTKAIIDALKPIAKFVLTITSDNGSEFANHQKVSKALNADYYFCHPYSSWERGLNENTNGLVRQYLLKGSCFAAVNDGDMIAIMDKLNSRPRKTLGYATPEEIFSSS